jgi:dipeptidyl aminopeptidase/acylaminoacyl peptidase
MIRIWSAALLLAASSALPVFSAWAQSPAPVDVAPFLRKDTYTDVKISPKGDYLAVTVPLEDRTALVVLRRADMQPTAKIQGGKDSVIYGFWWANDERVVASMAEKFGFDDKPFANGELYAVNADGSRGMSLTGLAQYTFAQMFDTLRDDDRNVLISSYPYGENSKTALEKLDIYNGKRSPVAASPIGGAEFTTDHQGVARFARGAGADNFSKLYYRDREGGEWRLINDEGKTGIVEAAIGMTADGARAYLQVERPGKPDAIVTWDPASGQRTEMLSDAIVDPYSALIDGQDRLVGARSMHDRVRTRFFDPESATAKLYRQLEKAFPNDAVLITSGTVDERLLVLRVESDRNPGDYYLFDTAAKKVTPLFARRLWLDPATMAPNRSVEIAARDGVTLRGYLTLPLGTQTGSARPMVVVPHGGPFGVFDTWWFDAETQMLAKAGYAVLRVNFRGSGNYGRDFAESGARQWGRKLQFDLTDATRWAIEQKIADPKRICMYGASYGAYAALMGVASEPDLYRCAAGYVGVYDMVEHHKNVSNATRSRSGRLWVEQWLGPRETMAAISVATMADKIKAPVFLAAGGKDEIAPIEHSEKMEKALRAAGTPVETLYYPQEGHGFYVEAHQREFYVRLLNFFSRHLGGAPAK